MEFELEWEELPRNVKLELLDSLDLDFLDLEEFDAIFDSIHS
jgi:hypothetical protein